MTLIMNADYMNRLAAERMRLRLSNQVRALRVGRGWTLGEVAKRANVQLRDVWRVESGYLKHITIKTLHRLACAFGVAFDIRFMSLADSLRQIGRPVDVPSSFEQEVTQ